MALTSQSLGPLREVDAWHKEAQQALKSRDFRRAHERCLRILQRAPRHADAMFLLGMIAAEHGNFGKAAEVIERAIGMNAGRAEYHAHLARCLIALHYPVEAMAAAQRALSLDPIDALTLDTIGVVMTRAGMHADAVAPFRRALQIDNGKSTYHYNLGAALQFIGDFEGAKSAYRDAIAIDPAHYRAWSSLAQVSRKPFDITDVAHIKGLLQQAANTAGAEDAELHLSHALAKHFEDQADYARSFEILQRGKQRKRSSVHYALTQDLALFDAVRETCTPAFLDAMVPASSSGEPIFIVGMPRTGTTLVERILSSHSEVFSAGELTNFALGVKRAAKTAGNLVLDVPTLRAASAIDWQRVGDQYVASTRPRTGHTPRFIDKMPLNCLYAGFIRRALPNAKIICVRRNPLDTCLSNYRQLFATNFPYYHYSYDLLDAGRYYVLFDTLMRYWRETLGDHYYEIRYEDVVTDTEQQARKLLAFCGLQWEPGCLNFHENTAPVATASSVQVRQPIYKTSMERWRHYERELTPLKALLEEAGVPLGPPSS
jgi:tetratricopeptide (TPR) repeat protein